jgi:hypothetical protein
MKITRRQLRKIINENIFDMFTSKHNEIPERDREPNPRILDTMNPNTFEKRIKDIERELLKVSDLDLESYSEGSTTDFSRMGIESMTTLRNDIINHLRDANTLGYVWLPDRSTYGPPPPISDPKAGVVYPAPPTAAWNAMLMYLRRGGSLRARLTKKMVIAILLAYGAHKTRRTMGQGIRDLFGGTFFGDNRPDRSSRKDYDV